MIAVVVIIIVIKVDWFVVESHFGWISSSGSFLILAGAFLKKLSACMMSFCIRSFLSLSSFLALSRNCRACLYAASASFILLKGRRDLALRSYSL